MTGDHASRKILAAQEQSWEHCDLNRARGLEKAQGGLESHPKEDIHSSDVS